MMNQPTRNSVLASRHRALGSDLEDWNGMGTAWRYSTDPNQEHDAIREAAGLFDMSPLKKVFIRGPDASRIVNHVMTRDMAAVSPGSSVYGTILTDSGRVCDDAIVANNGNDEWMHCHGSGESMQRLLESASGLNADIELDDDLHDLSLQGPGSLELLASHTPAELSGLPYFHHLNTELFGFPCTISRTGYSGERGYEIFVSAAHAGDIWDHILGHGENAGVMPCSFASLDKVRIEAGLLFYGYDMSTEHTPWEVGLGFTVSRTKDDYRGKTAVLASANNPRFIAAGIASDKEEDWAGGERLLLNDREVGVLNSPCWSHRLGKSLALVHLQPEAAVAGTRLQVIGEDTRSDARVENTPFYDPTKSRTHA